MGGAEVQQTLIAGVLLGIGCEVSVLVHDLGQPDEVVTRDGIRLIKAYRKNRRFRDFVVFWRHPFWVAMKRADADVYYQRASGTMTGVIAILCRLLGRPFVHATSIDLDLDGTKEKRLNPVKRAVYRYGIRKATAVVVQTDQQNANLRRRFGRDGVIIPNTVALPEERAARNRRFVLWVSSFRDHKRPEMFLDLAERLPDQEFVMVGGPFHAHPELYDAVRKRAETMPNMRLTGTVPYGEVGKYFDEAKIFVCTSTMEGFPNTFLQAWCRGVPVVTTFDPDGSVQKHDIGRYCVTMEDLVEAVRLLSSNDELREQMGSRAVEYVKQNHGPDVVGARYKELLGNLLPDRIAALSEQRGASD